MAYTLPRTSSMTHLPSARAALSLIALWYRRARTRAALSRLEAHRLADVGLDARTAAAEAAKPFWRA